MSADKPRIVIAGGSGFIGQALCADLKRDYTVIVLTRSPSRSHDDVRFTQWDGRTIGDWWRTLEGASAIINLAGRHVSCRYTPQNRLEIDASRVDSVNAIAQAITRCGSPPGVWVQASTTAIYGDAGDNICDESAPHGSGFPVRTATLWERTFAAADTPRTRRVVLRISFVLGPGGGVLELLSRLTRRFLGGQVGTGRQYISWIHIKDLVRIVRLAIERNDMQGVYNTTGPTPLTNAAFMRSLRRALHRPWSPPAPAWAVKLGCWFFGTEAELALTGRRCIPKRLDEIGFRFEHSDLDRALASVV